MNERIKELIQMADLCAAGLMASGATEEEIQNRSKVVLANLIVKECVRYFKEDYQRDFDSLWREDLSKGIKQHFGIEE
jgi:hypothetical protein